MQRSHPRPAWAPLLSGSKPGGGLSSVIFQCLSSQSSLMSPLLLQVCAFGGSEHVILGGDEGRNRTSGICYISPEQIRDKVLYLVQPGGRNDALVGAAGKMLQGGPAAILASTDYEDNSSTLRTMHAG